MFLTKDWTVSIKWFHESCKTSKNYEEISFENEHFYVSFLLQHNRPFQKVEGSILNFLQTKIKNDQ